MDMQKKDLFDFMLKRVKYYTEQKGEQKPQAFVHWFSDMYFSGVTNVNVTDGSGDGKVDAYVTCHTSDSLRYHVINSKFTNEYDRPSPVSFYDEITRFWQAFENKNNRPKYLEVVREDLKPYYKKLFKLYDDGKADLYFITNHKINEKQYASVENYRIKIFHLDDILQYVAEHIEGAMPETDPLYLSGISTVLTPAKHETEVATSIVFARLIDFIKYIEDDPFELLFARNVRLWLGKTETNKEIELTFKESPKEFAYSNNGITLLCKKHTHDPGTQELKIENPRVVNGSQTLHSIRQVENPSSLARVMVRIIEIPSVKAGDLPEFITKRKEIIHKISIRSNLQNPIRKWNLVANDDFQNELARYFWSKNYYYERRQNEWKYRKIQLMPIGIKKGPDIRWMTQLIASYNFDQKYLGPAVAQGTLNELFDENAYKIIRETSPRLGYHLFLLSEVFGDSLYNLKTKKEYIKNVYGYIKFCLFSLVCKITEELNIKLDSDEVEYKLINLSEVSCTVINSITKDLVDLILLNYQKHAKQVLRDEEKQLSYPTYFKNRKMITDALKMKIPKTTVNKIKSLYK